MSRVSMFLSTSMVGIALSSCAWLVYLRCVCGFYTAFCLLCASLGSNRGWCSVDGGVEWVDRSRILADTDISKTA